MDPFIGQIMLFGGNFAPRGWAFCEGQLLPIASNSALFSILGTIYGGDGSTTFALPDLRGRVSIHPGNGPGLSDYRLGERGGQEDVVLNVTQIPSHTHFASGQVKCNFSPATPATATSPVNGNFANAESKIYNSSDSTQHMAANGVDVTVGNTGGSREHTNMQPFLCANYIIALQGVYPSRS